MGSSSSKADGASWHDTVRQNASNLETSAQRTSETVGIATRAAQQGVGHYGQAAVNTAAALHETSQQLQGSASQAGTHIANTAGAYRPPTVYDAAIETATPATTGGSCCGIVIGGGFFSGGAARTSEDAAADLKSYRYSKASAAKDRFIRGLARAMKAAGIKVDPEAEPEEIIRELQKNLPHPKKGNSFSENGDAQAKICRLVAEKMNAEFAPSGDKIFDTTMSPKAICLQLTDLVGSLAIGLNSEYLEVHASLTRNLRNLEILETILRNAHARILEDAKRGDYTGNEKAREDLADVEFYYQRAEEMRQRQVRLIENTLAVVLGDRQDELALALNENSDVYETVKKLGDLPGGKRTADTIAQVLYGTASVASVADKVDKALKETGLKVQEYLEAADTKAMKDRLFKLQQSRPDLDLGEFLRAQTILVDNFWRREELDSALRAKGEARGGARGRKRGGEYRSALDKRVEKQKVERRLIVRQFIGRMTGHYDDFLKAVNDLGPHIGKEIPLSDRLANLRDEFDALAKYATGRAGIELNLALIGYLRDISARQEKERFLSTMTAMVRIIDDVAELDMYRGAREYFARLRSPIAEMISTINYFTEQIQKKFGGDGDADADGGAEDVADVVKDIDHDAAQVGRSAYDLATATAAFKYYYFAARIRENLRQSSAEVAAYGDKYKDVLGDAVAGRLRQLKAERDSRVGTVGANNADLKKWLDDEYAVKEQFYRALQAIDLQLHSFTDGIARHPEAVSDISRILEGVQAIAKWYVEDTGDNIARAFDQMPTIDGAAVAKTFQAAGAPQAAHYYESAEVKAGNVGVPQMFQAPKEAAEAEKFVKKALKEFQALRQIINAFVRIGDKFGGKSVWRDGMIMGPSKIVDALTDYLRQSAFSVGSSSVDPATGARDAPVISFAQAGAGTTLKDALAGGAPIDSGIYFASCGRGPALAGTFQTENAYFVMTIKAMIAKVLTVLGVFDMFERPGPIANLTQTRIILGGGPEEEVARPEAAELYFRLVRLAEFYKDLFDFKAGSPAKMQISMLPDVEGVFSGLIRLIFQKVVDPASGDYSDTEIRALIGECNLIYRHFHAKDSANAVQAALVAFVAEINRRYGAIRAEDWKAFQTVLNLQRRGATGLYNFDNSANPTSFAILPDEDDDEPYDGRAPSDRFMNLGQVPGTAAAAAASSRYDLDTVDEAGRRARVDVPVVADKSFAQLHMLREFRQKIEALFSGASAVPAQYGTMIRQAATEMERAGSPDARFAVASRLILGSGALSAVDSVKILMFEETVGLGLDLLEMIGRVLAGYRNEIAACNLRVLRECRGANPAADYLARTGVALAGGILGDRAYTNDAEWDANVFYEAVLHVVFDTVFGLATDFQNLVQVRFPNSPKSQLFLDFGKLRALIEELFADTGYYLDAFRTQLPRESLKPFEDRLRALDVQLEDLIRGPPALPEEEGREQDKPGTLEWMSRTLNSTFVLLTNPKWPVGDFFARKVFYDVSDGASVKGGQTSLSAEQGKGSVVARVLSGTSQPKAGAYNANNWFKSYDDIAGTGIAGPNESVMLQFNTFVAKYVRSGFDVATNKIYRGLVDSFANGAFSRAVMQPGNAYPDLSSAPFASFGVRGDPKNGAVLAESLALALRALVTKYDPRTQMSIHLTATLSEVPLYIKEGFRANLPVYANLFGLLHKKGELIKQMVGLTALNLTRTGAPSAAAVPIGGATFLDGAGEAAYSPADTQNRLGDETTKQTLIEVIDSVSAGCYTLGGSIAEILRELADTSPVYLETQENSISRYRSSNGTLPIMPLSLCAWPLKITQMGGLSVELAPEYTSGDARFKFMYGTRKLLGHPTASVSLADMPGAEQILQKFNGTAENRDKLTTERYGKFAENVVSIVRYLVGFRHYRAAMGIDFTRRMALIDAVVPGAVPTKSHVYALTAGSAQEVISIVEGSYQEEIVQRLTKVFSVGAAAPVGQATLGRRQDEWRDNIIDMNIIPINVHALMRGIPLAPLYNYAYTFDEMVCVILGRSFRDVARASLNANVGDADVPKTAVDAFLALLTDPLAPVSDAVFGKGFSTVGGSADLAFVVRMFRGAGSLPFGRPKFLSDQVFNKALLGNLYASKNGNAAAATPAEASNRPEPGMPALTYLAETGDQSTSIKAVTLTMATSVKLREVGKLRFDTVFIRNLVFIVNAWRVMRLKLNIELTQYRNVLVESHGLVNPGITEFGAIDPDNNPAGNPAYMETSTTRRYGVSGL